MDILMQQQPDVMINIAASPFAYNHDEERIAILSDNASRYKLPLIYVNHVGAQTELIFDGGSLAMNAEGKIIQECNYFEEDFVTLGLEDGRWKMEAPAPRSPLPASNLNKIE